MRDPRYSTIPARAVFDPRLALADVRILAAFGSNNENQGWCDASQSDLAQRMGVTRQTVNAAIRKLMSIGYIETRPLTAPGRGKIGTQYRVLFDLAEPYRVPLSGAADIGSEPTSAKDDTGADVGKTRQADVGSSRQRIYNDNSSSSSERLELREEAAAALSARASDCPASIIVKRVNSPFLSFVAERSRLAETSAEVGRWLAAGADLELDVIPTVTRITARQSKPVRVWGYFTDAVREAAARRLAPVEPIQPAGVSHLSSPSASEPGIRRGKLSPSSVILLRQLAASDEDDLGRVDSLRVS